jgi:hypothetical protein
MNWNVLNNVVFCLNSSTRVNLISKLNERLSQCIGWWKQPWEHKA